MLGSSFNNNNREQKMLHSRVSELELELETNKRQLFAKNLRLNELQQRLDLVYDSFSWRITAPLRRIADWLGRRTGVTIAAAQSNTADQEVAYAEWVRQYDTLTPEDIQTISSNINQLEFKPLISIVMPVYNTPEQWLRIAIESVLAQIYSDWELCIADDASSSPHVRPLLEEYQQRDPRIKVVFRSENGHISAASNSALALATGEFIALLDHDDELAPHALYMVAVEVNRHPDADIIYSDEDKIDEEGRRFQALFKPDWNPDLFFSQNYISHLGVYRTSIIKQIGGFRIGYEGSQDYDLCLRCVANTETSRIRHIPLVLYHWRAIAGSTAVSTHQKSYAEQAAVRALSDYFQAIHKSITVKAGKWHTTYVVTYPLPETLPLVSLIIPTRDGYAVLKRCIESIRKKTDYQNYELIIVDNQSTESETLDYLKALERRGIARILRYDAPFNYSAINNFAVQEAAGEIVGLLNNDLEVISKGWLTEMVRHVIRPEIGAVGAKLYYPTNRIQHAGVALGIGGVAGHLHHGYFREQLGYSGRLVLVQDFSAVTAACLLVRKAVYEEVGGLDEENLAIAYNDIDFCLKVREAGYRNLWTPFAELYHHESFSRGYETSPEKQARFDRETALMRHRWGSLLDNDPYYSPNLTLDAPDYTLAWPPRVDKPWDAVTRLKHRAQS